MAAAWSRDDNRTEELPAQSVDQSWDAREAELDQANLQTIVSLVTVEEIVRPLRRLATPKRRA
jgi:hypothetical protein